MFLKRKIIAIIFGGCCGLIMTQAVNAATCPATASDGTLNCAPLGKVACGGVCVSTSSISSITCTAPETFNCSVCTCTGGTTPIPVEPWSINPADPIKVIYNTNQPSSVGINSLSPGAGAMLEVKGPRTGIVNVLGAVDSTLGEPTYDWSMIRFGETNIADASGYHFWYLTKRNDGTGNADGRISIYEHTLDNLYPERFTINKGGNIGLGITYPTEKLDVNGAISINNNRAQLYSWNNGTELVGGFRVNENWNGSTDVVVSDGPSGIIALDNAGWQINAYPSKSAGSVVNSGTYGKIFVGSNGRVGINTTTPAKTLSVSGDIQSTGDICAGNKCLNSLGSSQWSNNGTSIYYNGGNVGIGTSTPSNKFHIYNGTIEISGGTQPGIKMAGARIYDGYDGILHLRSGEDTIAFDGNGDDIVIGASSPANIYNSRLEIIDNVNSPRVSVNTTISGGTGSNAYSGYQFGAGNVFKGGFFRNNNNDSVSIWSSDASGPKITIQNNGNVGIGAINPAYNLSVDSNINGADAMVATNINSGAAAIALVGAANGPTYQDMARLAVYGNGFTTSGAAKRDGAELRVGPELAGGLSITSMSTIGDIRFYTGGGLDDPNQRMVIKFTGDVGIGTTSPAQKLSVTGNILASGDICTGSGKCLNALTSADNLGNHTATQNIKMSGKWLSNDGDNEGVFVHASGNVGIGDEYPATKLSIKDVGYNGLQLLLRLTNPNNTVGTAAGILFETEMYGYGKGALVYERKDTYGRGSFHVLQNKDAQQTNPSLSDAALTIQNNGNVGIGTVSPATKIHAKGVSGVYTSARIESQGAADSGLELYYPTGRNGGVFMYANSGSKYVGSVYGTGSLLVLNGVGTTPVVINTNGAERMRINSSGNVGIGTTSPAQKLSVSGGNILLDNNMFIKNKKTDGTEIFTLGMDTGNYLQVGTGSGFNGIRFWSGASTEAMRITNSGNVGIGTTVPGTKLDVNGAVNVTGNITGGGEINGQYLHINGNGVNNINGTLLSTNGNLTVGGRITGGALTISPGTGNNDIRGLTYLGNANVSIETNGAINGQYLHIRGGGDNDIGGNLSVTGGITGGGEINGQYLHIRGGGDNDIVGNLEVKGRASINDASGLNGSLKLGKTPISSSLPVCGASNRGEIRYRECKSNAVTACKDRIVVCVWHDAGVGDNGSYQWMAVSWEGVAE